MADNILHVTIQYNVKLDEFAVTSTNIKDERLESMVIHFLRSQAGQGVDLTPANELDIYTIELQVDLSDDSFYCKHDCGNKGLREGLLIHFIKSRNPSVGEA